MRSLKITRKRLAKPLDSSRCSINDSNSVVVTAALMLTCGWLAEIRFDFVAGLMPTPSQQSRSAADSVLPSRLVWCSTLANSLSMTHSRLSWMGSTSFFPSLNPSWMR